MDEFSIGIEAPPGRVWSLITDVTQMGRWSPECWSCTWLDGAPGAAVGARSKGRNRRGLMRWSTISTVIAADEPEHFAFEVDNSGMRWGYRIEAAGTGSRVTEYREEIRAKPWWVRVAYAIGILGRDPDAIVRRGMSATLERLKVGAEAEASR
jgi:uncharacterized protein YndB with AHSA1/START domain